MRSERENTISSRHGFNEKYLEDIIIVLVVGMSGFLTIPHLFRLPGSGLDFSWQLALHIAAAKNFQFGKDIIFTFGPLGFFSSPIFYDATLWVVSLTATLFVHLLFFYSLIVLMKRSRTTIEHYLFISVVLLIYTPVNPIEHKLLFAIIILLQLTITGRLGDKSKPFILIFSSLLMAIGSLIKFTALLISLSILFFLLFFFIYNRQFKYFFYMLLTYILSVLFIWIIAGQDIANLPTYVLNSIEVAKGYTAAMSHSTVGAYIGPMKPLYLAILAIGLFVLILFFSGLEGKFNVMVFILIFSGFIFLSFKNGFVRGDDYHIHAFFANMLLVMSLLYMLHREDIGVLMRSLTLIVICLLAFCILNKYQLVSDFSGKMSAFQSELRLVAATANQKELSGRLKEIRKKEYALKRETLQYIDGKSMDIFPWEISLPYAYDLKWSPRPVIQSYSVYTDKLDILNARHFEGVDAPAILLYSFQSIDGRYPIFDEPATFRTLLRNYRPVMKDVEFIIFEKRPTHDSFAEHTVCIAQKSIGEEIAIPKIDNGYLFGRIHMSYSVLGKIVNLFYKTPPVYLYFIDSENISSRYRFIPFNAQNGVFLSEEITNQEALYNVWEGKLIKNCDAMRISTSTPIFYKKNIKIEFFAIRKALQWTEKEKPIQWDTMQKNEGGSFSIETINDSICSPKKQPIVVNASKNDIITITGYALDEKADDAAAHAVYVTLDGKPIARAHYGLNRSGVPRRFKKTKHQLTGWDASIDTSRLPCGVHRISVRIVAKNKKSYYEPTEGYVWIRVRRDS